MAKMNFNRLAIKRVMVGICAAWFALQLQACKKATDTEITPIVSVEAEQPETGSISEHLLADATLAPLAQAAISPKITAPVRQFYVIRGTHVKQGELLATLENRDLAAQQLDSQGQLASANASLEAQTTAQLPEDEAKAELDVAQTKAQLHVQTEITASRQKLYQQGAISGHDYDTSEAQLAQAQVAYDNARNHVRALKLSKQPSIDQVRGQVTSAKGKYEAAQAVVSYSQIRSPINGVVTDRPFFPGETATTGVPLITIMDTSALLAKVHLSQMLAQRLHLGDVAAVTIPGVEGPVGAKVTLISPALDPGSTTVEVWLRVENVAGIYKAGTPVRTSIVGRTIPSAIKVPLSAILRGQDGLKSVMVVRSDSTAHKVNVQTGIDDGEDVQITQGLGGTEKVITTGGYGLDEGTKVRIGKPESDGDAK